MGARSDDAAIGEAHVRRGESRHLVDRFLEAEELLFADVDAQHLGERAVAARMAARGRTVRADVGIRPGDQRRDVIRPHAGAHDGIAFALRFRALRHVHQGRRRIHAFLLRDLRDRHSFQRRLRRIARDQQSIRRRDAVEGEFGFLAIGEVALRKQHAQVRVPVFVGIDVAGDVDALRARAVQHAQEALRLAPPVDHRELHVRDLHRDLRLAADPDDLVERRPEPAVLAADVADVAAAVSSGLLRQARSVRRSSE